MKNILISTIFVLFSTSAIFAQVEEVNKKLCDCGSNVKDLHPVAKNMISTVIIQGATQASKTLKKDMEKYTEEERKTITEGMQTNEFYQSLRNTKECAKVIKPMYQKLSDSEKADVDTKAANNTDCSFALMTVKEQIKKEEDKNAKKNKK